MYYILFFVFSSSFYCGFFRSFNIFSQLWVPMPFIPMHPFFASFLSFQMQSCIICRQSDAVSPNIFYIVPLSFLCFLAEKDKSHCAVCLSKIVNIYPISWGSSIHVDMLYSGFGPVCIVIDCMPSGRKLYGPESSVWGNHGYKFLFIPVSQPLSVVIWFPF